MTIENLEKELQNEIMHPIYLLYGDETFLLESFVKKVTKIFGEKLDGINYIKLGENETDKIIDNIETPSFGYDKKLIIIKNSNLFKKRVGATSGRPRTCTARPYKRYCRKIKFLYKRKYRNYKKLCDYCVYRRSSR